MFLEVRFTLPVSECLGVWGFHVSESLGFRVLCLQVSRFQGALGVALGSWGFMVGGLRTAVSGSSGFLLTGCSGCWFRVLGFHGFAAWTVGLRSWGFMI